MHQPRIGYNAKARASTAGGKKKGKEKRKKHQTDGESNAPIYVPKSDEQKDRERKEKIKQELDAQSNSKMNSKKKKRLEKYIDKKLKKEERIVLFEKLSQSQAQLKSTLHLQSSSTLGTGKHSTAHERIEKEEDRETRKIIEGKGLGKRKRGAGERFDAVDDEDEDDNDLDAGLPSGGLTVGSALVVAPRISSKKRGGNKTKFSSWNQKPGKPEREEDESDTSFDSSDSANDEDDDDSDSNSDSDSGSNEDDEKSTSEYSQEEELDPPPIAKKKLGFKDWALNQLSAAKGYIPPPSQDPIPIPEHSSPPPQPPKKKLKSSHPPEMRGPLGEDLILPSASQSHWKPNPNSTAIIRPSHIQESRLQLPIVSEEQPIMEAVLYNPVVVICGETGSGKTTQVPQFLFEAGFGGEGGMIGITQPRRVAAISTSHRVAEELSLPPSRVSYQIRYDATTSPQTSIKFMTDGVLLRELMDDFLLGKYSVVVVDEAHERSLNTDLLVGVLGRVVRLREEMWKEGKEDVRPLRLIIMSATLRVSDFTSNQTLFPSPPPVINVSARQHPVTIHFNRRTPRDYVKEAIKKTTKIHCRLPPGGILVFLTGQNEIRGVCGKLEGRFGKRALEERIRRRRKGPVPTAFEDEGMDQVVNSALADVEAEDLDLGIDDDHLAEDVDEGMAEDDPEALDSDDEEETRENESLGIFDMEETEVPMHIVPLYSLLPSEKQMRVFEPPPDGHRLVVVSTNVAETSLTIPGIRYVVDCGRAKERRYDINSGIQNFQISWTSKASAAQRAGRAGRTGPGHCYRLYSSALFEHYFEEFAQPEILRMPIEGVVLQMKSMGIDAVVNFPFPTPPDKVTLRKAEAVLTHLGALSVSPVIPKGGSEVVLSGTLGGRITDLGKAMSLFPLSPRFSRMIVGGRQHRCLPYVISIVSALSVGDPFIREEGISEDREIVDAEFEENTAHLHSEAARAKEAHRLRRKAFFRSQQVHGSLGNSLSDLFRLLSVVGAYSHAGGGQKFCADHFVRPKAMEEIHKLRSQLSNIVRANFPGVDAGFVPKLPPPSDLQLKVLRQLLAAAFIDQVAVRKDVVDKGSASGNKYATSRGVEYRAMGISEDVFIHPSSVLAPNGPPEYVVYHEVVRTSRAWLKGVTVINPAWLSSLGKPSLCSFSKPIKNSVGIEMVIPRFGPDRWELPPIKADSM